MNQTLMNKNRFLVLTDHSSHSSENSVYALMAKLSQHSQCIKLDVASRGNSANDAFFQNCDSTNLQAVEVNTDFSFDKSGKQFIENTQPVDVQDYDVIIMRLPRPISDYFLNFVTELGKDKVIINHPKGIQQTSTKAFLLNFLEICPPIRLCHSIDEILTFAIQFPIVLKPLKEYGGKGILRIDGDVLNDGTTDFDTIPYLENMKSYIETEGFLAMEFLKNVSQGDKRILVVNGQILASSLRLPAENSWLCNVAQGGRSVPSKATPEEIEIINTISPKLLEAGILIFGADTLVNNDGKRILSEINTLSIGGFPQAEKQTGKPILQQTIDGIINYVHIF
ncbi:MAG: glutathione synthase [Cognaticolwellia sp.]|jgi:glutathione synthase